MISPSLQDPRTVLTVLKGAPLSIIFAMCQDDCPRPTSVRWLEVRTAYGRGVLEIALEKLKALELVIQRGIKKASGWWLCHGIRQLALPFVKSLPSQATISFLPLVGSDPAVSGTHLTESATDSDPATVSGHRLISGAVGSDPAVSGTHLTESAKDNVAKKTTLSSQLMDQLDPNLNINFGSQFDSPIDQMPKKTALSFLTWLGFWPDDVADYADKTDMVRALAAFWYATVSSYDSPVAFVRLVIDRKRRATTPYEILAKAWLEMDDDHRQVLAEAIIAAPHNYKQRLILPPDFGYYIPFRELLLVWRACNGRIAPPELMPLLASTPVTDTRPPHIPAHLVHIIKR